MLNVATLTELTYFFLQDMLKKESGTIINIASTASFNPLPFSSVYSATKSYVLTFTESLYYEYKDLGIKFLAVCPGATNTHFFDDFNSSFEKKRQPSQVVTTTLKALRKNKHYCVDGIQNYIQVQLSRIGTRRFVLNVAGRFGKKIWGSEAG